MGLEHKSFPALGLKLLDEDLGIVEHVITVFGIIDLGMDISHPGSFTKTIQEYGTKVLVLDQHRTDTAMAAVGKPLELREISRHELPLEIQEKYPDATGGVLAKTQFLMDTPEGKGIFIRIKEDALREWSYGYETLDSDMTTFKQDGKDIQCRNLRTIKLYEYSPVLWGMNQATVVIGAKGDDGGEDDDDDKDKTPPESKPYGVFKQDDEYCVFKVNEDGDRTGEALGCHPSESAADEQIQAIYASEELDKDQPKKEEQEPAEDVADIVTTKLTTITVTIELPEGREVEVLSALKTVSVTTLLNAVGAPEESDPLSVEDNDKSDKQAAGEAGPGTPPTSDLLQRLTIEEAELDLILEESL